MKGFFIITFLSLFIMSSCNSKKTANTNLPIIPITKLDTVIEGNLGQKGSSISVYHRWPGHYTKEWHYKSWDEDWNIHYRNQYYDSLGNIRYNHCKLWFEKKLTISYGWDNELSQSILSIDSTYKNNKLISSKITIWKQTDVEYDKLFYSIDRKYKNNKITETKIIDFIYNYEFLERGNGYYEMETDINYRYAEWESSSKSRFGRTYSEALQKLSQAYSTIDTIYLLIAKNNDRFDLKAFIQNEVGL